MMQIIPNLKETAVKRKTRRVLIALLTLVFAGSLGMLIYSVVRHFMGATIMLAPLKK